MTLALLGVHGVGEDPLRRRASTSPRAGSRRSRWPSSGRSEPTSRSTGPSAYGYAPLQERLARKAGRRPRARRARDRHLDGEPARRSRRRPRPGDEVLDRGADLLAAHRRGALAAARRAALPAARGGRLPRRPAGGRAGAHAAHPPRRAHEPPQPVERVRRRRTTLRAVGAAARVGRRPRARRRGLPRVAGRARPAVGLGRAPRAGVRRHLEPHQGVRPLRPALRLGDRRARPRAAHVAAQRPVRRRPCAPGRAPERRRARPPRPAGRRGRARSSRRTRRRLERLPRRASGPRVRAGRRRA